jgi:hypothetical protein
MVTGKGFRQESVRATQQQCSNAFEDLLTLAFAQGSSVNAMTILPTDAARDGLAGAVPASTGRATLVANAATLRRAYWVLRVAAAGCFVGHGAFGIITKAAWVPYFGVVGIPNEWAYRLMPVVGSADIAAGIAVLLSPRPFVLLYMVVWATWTALLRPLAGESVAETLERAGNYGVPLALLLFFAWPRTVRAWFSHLEPRLTTASPAFIATVLSWTTGLLLFGHGSLAAITGKPLLASHFALVGLPGGAITIAGWAEMIVALIVVVRPTPALLFTITAWKIATEALYPMSGTPIWEFIERSGSYAAPLALALILIDSGSSHFTRVTLRRSSP